MFRILLVASTAILAAQAMPAAASTTIISFSQSSCAILCGDGGGILQTVGDTANVNVTYTARNGVGNTNSNGTLVYWSSQYSNSDAAYAGSAPSVGELRFNLLNPGTLTLNSVGFGGWPNTQRNIQVRVYDLSYNSLFSSSVNTTPSALVTFNFGQISTSGLIFQFGPDSANGGIQNVSYSFNAVPEPASWAMLIVGFGLIGAALRRRRTVAA